MRMMTPSATRTITLRDVAACMTRTSAKVPGCHLAPASALLRVYYGGMGLVEAVILRLVGAAVCIVGFVLICLAITASTCAVLAAITGDKMPASWHKYIG